MDSMIKAFAVLALAFGLGACGESGGGEQAGGADTGAETTAPETGGTEQVATQTESDSDASPAGDYPQATIDGAMTMFVDSLAVGDFALAADVCDPTSIEVQEAFAKRIENLSFPHPNPNVSEEIIDKLREIVAKSYEGASWDVASEADDQATVTLTLADGRSSDLTLIYEDQAWWVFPYDGFLDWADRSISPNAQQSLGGG